MFMQSFMYMAYPSHEFSKISSWNFRQKCHNKLRSIVAKTNSCWCTLMFEIPHNVIPVSNLVDANYKRHVNILVHWLGRVQVTANFLHLVWLQLPVYMMQELSRVSRNEFFVIVIFSLLMIECMDHELLLKNRFSSKCTSFSFAESWLFVHVARIEL